ncbi:NAD-dependent epimerase/dehydratase family protein [Roseomonas xinghualingensis]|uniref:NAD-dependent epimerase/dehydratase family protein n=1 Tax=Roseomonas xinghualingensis TaxID=2986475 RepID=UPI0021F14A0C|nr:NAD-dependent epimerase/dehydratase family protein [Roseomonas sp. SXEYE001]MCV4208317.1 NAD-dependent epimerase/dehydratase family protein [Roseomonas sp. SXEYE001]
MYLVTGGCGFIGSHLCAALRARGDQVRVLDDLSTGSEENLAPGVDLVRGNVADPVAVRAAMEGVNGCFHLAAIASVERGVREWLNTHQANLCGTIGILEEAARARGRIPVVYASSAAVYGDCDALPLTEDAPTWPLSAYGADKLGCELHARVAGVVHQVPSIGLRFFNVFGPRQDPRSPYSGVISIFCDRLSRGEPVTIFGDGGQTRDFVFVADVVIAMMAAMGQASTAAPVLNVCTGRPTSVRELAAVVANLCSTRLEVRQQPPRSGEIRHSLGSPSLAQAKLGLPSPEGLSTGLAQVVAWLRAGRPGLAPASQSANQPADRRSDYQPAYQ